MPASRILDRLARRTDAAAPDPLTGTGVDVYNFGSINVDHVYRVAHLVRPGETLASASLDSVLGGKGANQSVALARAGARVRHVGRIGEADAALLDVLTGAGVDCARVARTPGTSGHAIIQVDDAGENAIVLHGGANRGFDASILDAALADARPGDWLLAQNECDALDAAFAAARARGMRIAFNPAPMDASVAALPLDALELLIVNETEALGLAAALAGADAGSAPADARSDAPPDAAAAIDALAARLPGVWLVATLGADGAVLVRDGERTRAAAPRVDVVDTTGAGDTFVGYLLAALIEGLEPEAALDRAVAAGALATTRAGATPSIPTADEVDAARAASRASPSADETAR